ADRRAHRLIGTAAIATQARILRRAQIRFAGFLPTMHGKSGGHAIWGVKAKALGHVRILPYPPLASTLST
ncbi:MAG: hypothetical protein O2943_06240, partial [Actinomycetota bacterium]|nr:hypothetical protein [Actinomycetota bacterium]